MATHYSRRLADGRVVEVYDLTFGRARLSVGDGATFYEDSW